MDSGNFSKFPRSKEHLRENKTLLFIVFCHFHVMCLLCVILLERKHYSSRANFHFEFGTLQQKAEVCLSINLCTIACVLCECVCSAIVEHLVLFTAPAL